MKGAPLGFRVSPLGANGPIGAAADGLEVGSFDGNLEATDGAVVGIIVEAVKGSCIPVGVGGEDVR